MKFKKYGIYMALISALILLCTGCASPQTSAELPSESAAGTVEASESQQQAQPSVAESDEAQPAEETAEQSVQTEQKKTAKDSAPEDEMNGNNQQDISQTAAVTINGTVFEINLEDNKAAGEFADMFRDSELSIEMSDYGGFEKVGPLGASLTADNVNMTTSPGDIVLYNGNQIVMFYGTNTWDYTKLGSIDDLTSWDDALGSGDITAVFSSAE